MLGSRTEGIRLMLFMARTKSVRSVRFKALHSRWMGGFAPPIDCVGKFAICDNANPMTKEGDGYGTKVWEKDDFKQRL